MGEIVFQKAKGRGRSVSKTIVYSKEFFKKDFKRNLTEFTREHLYQNVLFGFFL